MSEHGPDADGWREQQFPSGRVDLIAGTRSADHVPRLLEDVLVPASAEPARIELVLARSLRVEVVLAEGLEPPPEGVEILLVEEAYFDQVRPLPETDSWESGPLGPAFVKRFAYFDRKRTCEPGGLGPGRYRFKVEPPDIVVEPESVTLVEGENPPIELRWRYAK
jgi:hypothetical protein